MLTSQKVWRREVSSATYVCLSCRLKSATPSPSIQQHAATRQRHGALEKKRSVRNIKRRDVGAVRNEHILGLVTQDARARSSVKATARRPYHTSRQTRQQAAALLQNAAPPPPDLSGFYAHNALKTGGVREQLRQWQELYGKNLDAQYKELEQPSDSEEGGASNNLTRLSDPSASMRMEAQQEEEEQRSIAYFSRTPEMEDGSTIDQRFLKMGDLIELEYHKTERESTIAVYVRRTINGAQILTMNGRWEIIPEAVCQYSVPGWISPKLVQPLLGYLPDPKGLAELDELKENSYMTDMSIPRSITGPLVSRMVEFYNESQEIYRKHSRALDNAHDILAHPTDLRYGSLVSAATALLKTPASQLPVTALFTVRKALTRAGFGFNIDRRSHRLTGYLQIRSKEQCKMTQNVRDWVREWQDDVAQRASLEGDEKALRKRKTKEGAKIIYSFLDKARTIVLESRKSRDFTSCGGVGPSSKKFEITPNSEAVRVTTAEEFTKHEGDVVRFMEGWACSDMFHGLPRLQSVPMLILQATGLYDDFDFRSSVGFTFLQELGTLMPYENRVRFDQHLLLPSSQHSKPLQALMTTVSSMSANHDFHDSMADLRHDFGQLPVYCIDDASAHEIDDGLSIEAAGEGQWWVHIHIANPTAFFNRDNPLAKMARHMGESIYMPDRTYMMLPRWVTKGHFSLANERPTLTFSVKLDREGKTLEHKIQSGFIRNVHRLTKPDVASILGKEDVIGDESKQMTVTVGGQPPPSRGRPDPLGKFTAEMKDQIRSLNHLSEKRTELRSAAGGIFFEMGSPSVEVYQSYRGPGLAWDHPWRKGSRITEGDPIIRLQARPFQNWFAPGQEGPGSALVQEMMLLACETAGKWSAERKIPTIFRGTITKPYKPDPDAFRRDVVLPAIAKSSDGQVPMHVAIEYIDCLGQTALSTKPLKHKVLGMEYSGKVTSPLRRYGDMILHWQIEAALREEARTGQSLVTKEKHPDRGFLPFSNNVLETIMLGLQPREKMIRRAKSYADQYWIAHAIFRAFHYGEAKLPWTPVDEPPMTYTTTPQQLRAQGLSPAPSASATSSSDVALAPADPSAVEANARAPPRPPQNYNCHVFITSITNTLPTVGCQNMELNVKMLMQRPEFFGLPEVKAADVWEVSVMYVDLYFRNTVVKPVRLVHREEW